MSAEDNKAVVRRYYEDVLNGGDTNALGQLAVADYVEHNPLPGEPKGLQGLRYRVETIRTAFRPRFTVEDVIAEGDKVAVRWSQQATHVGDFMGIPATGKSFSITGMDVYVVKNAQLAEHWDVVDLMPFLQAIGAIPSPAQGENQPMAG